MAKMMKFATLAGMMGISAFPALAAMECHGQREDYTILIRGGELVLDRGSNQSSYPITSTQGGYVARTDFKSGDYIEANFAMRTYRAWDAKAQKFWMDDWCK